MKTTLAAALVLLAAATQAHAAQKTYDLSDSDPVVGWAVESTGTETTTSTTQVSVGGQVVMKEDAKKTEIQTKVEQITKVKDGVITEYTTRITASKNHEVKNQNGQVKENKDPSPLLNKTVTWKLVGDQYIPNLPNATEAQKAELEPQFYKDFGMYPDKPVAIGDTWTFDGVQLGKVFGEKVEDPKAGKGTFKFVGIEQYKGEACAKVVGTIEVELPINEPGIDPGKGKLVAKGTFYRSLKNRIDVGGDLALQATAKLKGKTPDGAFTVDVVSKGTIKGGEKIVK